MRQLAVLVLGAWTLAVSPSNAWATPITYVGRDTGVAYGGPFPVSDAVHAAFVAAISSSTDVTQTIDFESAPVGSFSSLVVGSGVTASFTNQASSSGISNANPSALGTFDTTRPGSSYTYMLTPVANPPGTETTVLTFTFSMPVDSFGAYIAGLGSDAPFSYNFNDGTGPQTLTSSGIGNGYGEVQFFGFTDFGQGITSVALDLTAVPPPGVSGWYYAIGVDDVTTASPVPEPASLILFGTGLLAVARRRLTRG